MQHFHNILVGIEMMRADRKASLDLTSPSQEAFDRAVWLAAKTAGQIQILTCLDMAAFMRSMMQPQLELPLEDMREAHELLARLVARSKAGGVEARFKVTVGAPWKEICRQVRAANHDIVIVGTRELGRAGRFLFGSTGLKLLRNCPCPVWIARPETDWEHLSILVPSDLSDVSLEALRVAVNATPLADTQIHLLHALDRPVGPPLWYGYVPPQMVQDYVAEQHASAKKKLHDQLAQAQIRSLQHGVQVHVVEGRADEVILQAIDDFHVGLVVMGTSARSGIHSLALGNTTERLVSQMRCSLLAVKPRGFECPVSFESGSEPVPSIATARRPVR
jgi:universal stress protein E